MQRLEVSGAVRPIYGSLGFKRLKIVVDKWHSISERCWFHSVTIIPLIFHIHFTLKFLFSEEQAGEI